jgi:hypothetical protein
MSTYNELLKHPKWQKKRLKILERDNWKCTHCLAPNNTLHVHHRYGYRGIKPWEYDDSELQTLCEFCHDLLKNTIPGSVQLLGGFKFSYEGCPWCGSHDTKNIGPYDKCLSCDKVICFFHCGGFKNGDCSDCDQTTITTIVKTVGFPD